MACRLVGAKPFIWTNIGTLLIGPLGTNFSEIVIWIQTFSFKKMPLKMSSAKWRPFCLGLNELTIDPFCNFAITELLYATLSYLDHDVLSVRRYHNPTIYIYIIFLQIHSVSEIHFIGGFHMLSNTSIRSPSASPYQFLESFTLMLTFSHVPTIFWIL